MGEAEFAVHSMSSEARPPAVEKSRKFRYSRNRWKRHLSAQAEVSGDGERLAVKSFSTSRTAASVRFSKLASRGFAAIGGG